MEKYVVKNRCGGVNLEIHITKQEKNNQILTRRKISIQNLTGCANNESEFDFFQNVCFKSRRDDKLFY